MKGKTWDMANGFKKASFEKHRSLPPAKTRDRGAESLQARLIATDDGPMHLIRHFTALFCATKQDWIIGEKQVNCATVHRR